MENVEGRVPGRAGERKCGEGDAILLPFKMCFFKENSFAQHRMRNLPHWKVYTI